MVTTNKSTIRQTTWSYDDLNRVTKEVITHYDTGLSQTQTWEYDAVGNRTKQVKGTQTTTYVYNTNDQLTGEQLTDSANSVNNRLTQRTYSASRLTQEICYRGQSAVTANQELRKDLVYQHDGPIYSTTLNHYNASGVFQRREFVRSLSDEHGQALMTDHFTNLVNNDNYTVKYRSQFVYDHHNPTGYSQAMLDIYNDMLSGTVPVRKQSHTFGHERISEKTTLVAQPNSPQKYFFLHDGHGNTRALLDLTGAVTQSYDYDAFGNAIGFIPSEALTQYLYCGELFDHKLGWTYLRARYYDPKTGRFNRLDPFFGNTSDPQSLHNYTYCHGDPVNHCDPTGRFFVGLAFSGFSVMARFGREAGYMAIATTALSSAFGAGTGAIGYYIAGENPWVGAYNGALIGAGVRIAFLTGGWPQVGRVIYDGLKSSVIRFASDMFWGLYTQALPDNKDQDMRYHLRLATLGAMDSYAMGTWNSATGGFLSERISQETQLIITFFDTAVNSLMSDCMKIPRPSIGVMAKNAGSAVSIEMSKFVFEEIFGVAIDKEKAKLISKTGHEVIGAFIAVFLNLGTQGIIECGRTFSSIR